ncbi:MAG TPA: 5-oxoprolinase subunit PxpB [Herpetosiphonaceae bacterium]
MSATIRWRVLPLGEAALLVEGQPADLPTNRAVIALARALDAAALDGVEPSVPAINTLLVPFDPLRQSEAALERTIHDLLRQLEAAPDMPARVVSIPVRYGGADGPDLPEIAARVGLTPQEVVALHCAQLYRVLLIGFAPGFPYLGPLPERLQLPRRATPRTSVPPGTVAIAADLSGIYPARLPGGWHLIGWTPLRLFDPAADPPSALEPGDGVRFVPLPDGVQP